MKYSHQNSVPYLSRTQTCKRIVTLSLLATLLAGKAYSAPLPEAVYVRCFNQMTGADPNMSSLDYTKVKQGTLSPINACLNVLSGVKLNSAGTLSPNNSLTVSVFNRFNRLHNSWFLNRDYLEERSQEILNFKLDLFDPTGPALFFTKTIFSPDAKFQDIFVGNANLTAVRSDGSMLRAAASTRIGSTVFNATFSDQSWVDIGDLTRIKQVPAFPMAYDYTNIKTNQNFTGTIDVVKQFGGGILGSPAYLQTTTVFPVGNSLDGGVKVLRRYGKSIMNDFLCRELPAALPADVDNTKFVDVASEVPFRTSSACTICHATMDQLAGGIRNIYARQVGEAIANNNSLGITGLDIVKPTTLPALPAYWDSTVDANKYSQRPLNGRLFYRTSEGALVDEAFTGLDQLGAALIEQDDVYRCVAKRYYEYFVGVSVPMAFRPEDLTADKHRDEIEKLADKLRLDGDLLSVVSDILKSEEYLNQ